jgi:SAM-dependent methyltransferase
MAQSLAVTGISTQKTTRPSHNLAVNYDCTTIPARYDAGRSLSPEVLARWMEVVGSHAGAAVRTILDLGCGTGRFAVPLAAHFPAAVVGVDPSARMLAQARRDPDVDYVQGHGEHIPLRDGSVDLVFTSMAYHHFTQPGVVAAECRRVLRSGGSAFVRTGVRERMASYPYAPFFTEAVPVGERRLPGALEISAVFESAGFQGATAGEIVQQVAASWPEYATRIAAGADSVLASLNPEQFRTGLRRLQEYAMEHEPGPVTETIDYFVFR